MAVNMVNLSLDVDAAEFYKMYSEYTSLKDRNCKTCTVCGSRQSVEKLKDAVHFMETLEMSEEKLVFLMKCYMMETVWRMKWDG